MRDRDRQADAAELSRLGHRLALRVLELAPVCPERSALLRRLANVVLELRALIETNTAP